MRTTLLIIAFFSFLAGDCQIFGIQRDTVFHGAHHYYVSPGGSDAANGLTPATAWATLAKVNSATFAAIDTVSFQGGAAWSGQLLITTSGTTAQQFLVNTYGTGNATINGGDGTGILLKDCAYVTLTGFTSQGSGVSTAGATTNIGCGIQALSTANATGHLRGVIITGNTVNGYLYGITAASDAPLPTSQTGWTGYDSLRIVNNDVSYCAYTGIFLWATSANLDGWNDEPNYTTAQLIHTNTYIAYNYVHDLYGFNGPTNCSTRSRPGTGIRITSASGGTVEYNLVTRTGHMANGTCGTPVNFEAEVARDIVWQYNESSYCTFSGTGTRYDGSGFDVWDGATQNMTIQYNYIHDNDGYGIGGGNAGFGNSNTGHVARFNLLVNNGLGFTGGDIQLWAENTNTEIYNNTIYSTGTGGSVVNMVGSVVNPRFSNNIIFSTTRPLFSCSSVTLFNNLYYQAGGNLGITINGTTYNTLAALRSAGFETSGGTSYGVTGDPLFTAAGNNAQFLLGQQVSNQSDYNISASSPAYGAWASFGVSVGTKDFHNTTITVPTNIGAMQ